MSAGDPREGERPERVGAAGAETSIPCAEVRVERLGLQRRLRSFSLFLFGGQLTAVLVIVAVMARAEITEALVSALLTSMMLTPLLALASLVPFGSLRKRAGSLSVRGDHLVIQREGRALRTMPLASLTEGSLSPLRRELTIRTRSGDRVAARVESPMEGRRLLEAAGLDEKRKTLELLLGETTFLTLMTWLLGTSAVFWLTEAIAHVAPWPAAFNVWVFIALFLGLLRGVREVLGPARLLIGADGVIIHQAFRDRFVPYEQIASVSATAEHVDLALLDGSTVRAKARHLTAEQRAEVLSRIENAREAWRGGMSEASALARLDRRGRSASAWREALAGLLKRDEGYREARLTREELLDALGSASASAERRLGAALALRAAGDEEATQRMRIAAEACANKKLRIALEKVAEGAGDDAAIEEAIAEEEMRVKRG
ncbi:MAG: hypothetical protein U0359_21675 [Byssovorax sp.]